MVLDPDHATRNCRKRLVPRLWTRAMRWKRIARRRRGRKGAAAKRRRTLAKQVFLVVRRARHAFLQKALAADHARSRTGAHRNGAVQVVRWVQLDPETMHRSLRNPA